MTFTSLKRDFDRIVSEHNLPKYSTPRDVLYLDSGKAWLCTDHFLDTGIKKTYISMDQIPPRKWKIRRSFQSFSKFLTLQERKTCWDLDNWCCGDKTPPASICFHIEKITGESK